MNQNNMNTLFKTVIGSHMWGMEREDSDFDIFRAYVAPTRKILDGTADVSSYQFTEPLPPFSKYKFDVSAHEIGKIVDMLLKGNVNFLWGVLSPIVIYDKRGILKDLRLITEKSLSKNAAKSIYGMSRHNYERYMRDNMGTKDVSGELLTKKANTIIRTIDFGLNILRGNGPVFNPVSGKTMEDVKNAMAELLEAEKISALPETPPNEDEFRDFLYRLRSSDLIW